jgi:predicted nucleic-acid-binding Zn-ribbon protein
MGDLMRFTQKCPICGSTEIIGPHKVYGYYGIRIRVSGFQSAKINALTCLMCGYTQLYADNQDLQKIKEEGIEGRIHDLSEAEFDEFCPSCGAIFENGSRKCSSCGRGDIPDFVSKKPLDPLQIPCENCGLSLDFGTTTCPACGFRKPESQNRDL